MKQVEYWKEGLFVKSVNDYMKMKYHYELVQDKRQGGFVISYPDLPGCITWGKTKEEAIRNGELEKKEWFSMAIEDEIEIPIPRKGGN